MSKELENLHQLRLKQAQKAPVQAIRSFIMNDSQNRTGLWEYITGWALIEGRLQQVNPKWRQFYKWFKEKDWELCNFNSFGTIDGYTGCHVWAFMATDDKFAGDELSGFDESYCQRGISDFFELGVDVVFAGDLIWVVERWEN